MENTYYDEYVKICGIIRSGNNDYRRAIELAIQDIDSGCAIRSKSDFIEKVEK